MISRILSTLWRPKAAPVPPQPAMSVCPIWADLKAKREAKARRHERVSDIDAALSARVHQALRAGR